MKHLLQLLYPPACLLCHAPVADADAAVCTACQASMPRVWVPASHEGARAPFAFEGPAREAVHAFKYHGHHRIGRWLAASMAQTARASLPLQDITAIVPVPMHWLKSRLRGSNPALELARDVAASLGLVVDARLLRRTRWTGTQTRLTIAARRRNMAGAFRASSRARHATLLLIDDVCTSGATAGACTQALREAGAARVFVLTAASARLN